MFYSLLSSGPAQVPMMSPNGSVPPIYVPPGYVSQVSPSHGWSTGFSIHTSMAPMIHIKVSGLYGEADIVQVMNVPWQGNWFAARFI